MTSAYSEILQRIEAAIGDARAIFARFTPGAIDAEFKAGHDPVTEADRAIDAVLRQNLLREGEGWLSEAGVEPVQPGAHRSLRHQLACRIDRRIRNRGTVPDTR